MSAVHAPLLDETALRALALSLPAAPRAAVPTQVAQPRLGEQYSPYRGSGMDYDESRPYRFGDDPRAIDWRLLARSGDLHVKQFFEERRPASFILIDRRAAMRFGTRRRLKVTQAARVATIAAFAAQRRGEALAGVMLESPPRWLPEQNDSGAALRLATAAAAAAPPLEEQSAPPMAGILSLLARQLKPGCRIWLLSDFHDLNDECETALLQLTRGHWLQAVQIHDPAELELPAAGSLQLIPPGGGEALQIDSSDPATASHFHRAASETLEQRTARLRRLGIPLIRLSTALDALEQELPW